MHTHTYTYLRIDNFLACAILFLYYYSTAEIIISDILRNSKMLETFTTKNYIFCTDDKHLHVLFHRPLFSGTLI